MMSAADAPKLDAFIARAKAWLDDHACRRTPMGELEWGEGSDDVSLFSTLTPAEEKAQVDAARAWRRLESDAGYGAISWPVEHGGAGLPRAYENAFRQRPNTRHVRDGPLLLKLAARA
jgi:alkylation response protein AidB-like acyl-CoA dehydrogenase